MTKTAHRRPLLTIKSILPSLTPAERRVADAVLAAPDWVAANSITALAGRCATSEATVVRFCKDAGYSGFPQLRLALTRDIALSQVEGRTRIAGVDVTAYDSVAEIVGKVGALDRDAIIDTTETLDIGSLTATIDAIASANRVAIYGIGASGLVAADLELKLRRIGLTAAASTDGHAAMTFASLLDPGSVAIGISHSGETADVVEPIQRATSRGATTVALTNFPRSPLATTADIVLITAVGESLFRSGAMASRVAQLTVIDCMFVGVAQRDFDRTMIALDETYEAIRSRRLGGTPHDRS